LMVFASGGQDRREPPHVILPRGEKMARSLSWN
jgi:hypothetical protein